MTTEEKAELTLKIVALISTFLIAGLFAMLVGGCSHNVITYSDGVGFETTFRPDSGNFGFVFRYGKILNATVRENTEITMTGNGTGSGSPGTGATGSASSSGAVKVKIGPQVTGYYVDAIKAGATPAQLEKRSK